MRKKNHKIITLRNLITSLCHIQERHVERYRSLLVFNYTAWVRTRLSKLQKGFTRLAAASDKVYQLLAHGRWFSPGTPASSTTKTGHVIFTYHYFDIFDKGVDACIALDKNADA
jgi:hypothetical protein